MAAMMDAAIGMKMTQLKTVLDVSGEVVHHDYVKNPKPEQVYTMPKGSVKTVRIIIVPENMEYTQGGLPFGSVKGSG